jgi:hypothetical protein
LNERDRLVDGRGNVALLAAVELGAVGLGHRACAA